MEEKRDLQVEETDEEGEGMMRLRRNKNQRKRWVGSGGSECHLIFTRERKRNGAEPRGVYRRR